MKINSKILKVYNSNNNQIFNQISQLLNKLYNQNMKFTARIRMIGT